MESSTDFKKTYHGNCIVDLRDLLLTAPDGEDKAKAIDLLTEIFNSAYGLWCLKEFPEQVKLQDTPTTDQGWQVRKRKK